jgi:hypothetical protein
MPGRFYFFAGTGCPMQLALRLLRPSLIHEYTFTA